MSYCDDCLHRVVCEIENVGDEAMTYCCDKLGWIPVSERLPEKHGDYLVTIENGDVINCYFNPDYCYDGYDNGAFTYTQEYFDLGTMGSLGAEEFVFDGVVAWMSYEPYKAESEEQGMTLIEADKTSALKAAETIREYCKSIPVTCEGCIFSKNDPAGLFFKGCFLQDPDHLPETWEIEKIKKENNT